MISRTFHIHILVLLLALFCFKDTVGQDEVSECLNGVEFILVNELVHFSVAVNECESRNAVVAAISSVSEHSRLVALASQGNFGRDIWMGRNENACYSV